MLVVNLCYWQRSFWDATGSSRLASSVSALQPIFILTEVNAGSSVREHLANVSLIQLRPSLGDVFSCPGSRPRVCYPQIGTATQVAAAFDAAATSARKRSELAGSDRAARRPGFLAEPYCWMLLVRRWRVGGGTGGGVAIVGGTRWVSQRPRVGGSGERQMKNKMMAGLLAVCAMAAAPAGIAQTAPDYAAIVAAPDRSDADRKLDTHRAPAQWLAFIGAKPGMKILDIFAVFGWKAELLARAVAPGGQVYAQIPKPPLP